MFGSEWNGVGGLLGIFGIGGKIVDDVKNSTYDEERKINARTIGEKTYIDNKGIERNVRNNHKTWHVTDTDGYMVTIDSKTKEILDNSHRINIERKNKESKERAIRAGDKVYELIVPNKTNTWAYSDHREWRRVCDDKLVLSDGGSVWFCTPKFHLRIGDSPSAIQRRRITIHKYCRDWYVEYNMKTEHPKNILKEAEEYGLKVFESDIDYCLDKINKAIENGGGIELLSWSEHDYDYLKNGDTGYKEGMVII